MKRTMLSLGTLLLATLLFGQAQEGAVEYQKRHQSAAVIELPYAPDIVRAALNEYLSRKGRSKATDLKGFTTFRNTQPLANDSANADLYFKIERKSRQDKEISVVSLLLTTPQEVTVTSNTVHHLNMEEAKTYLNDLGPAVEAYNLELLIKEQNADIISAESRYKNLVDDGTGLQRKKEDLERKIEQNRLEQQKQAAEVEALKQKLATKVSLRKA